MCCQRKPDHHPESEKLSSSTLTFADGAETLTKGIQEYTDGVSQVNEVPDNLMTASAH
ncbi:MAG: hypothetical protein ACLTML_12745 [Blautia faecis]